MAELYDETRVKKLKAVMCKFNKIARVGDGILFGIMGDNQWPKSYSEYRPSGTIIKIKNEGTESATLRIKTDKGKIIDLSPHNLDAQKVWEFDPPTFANILERIKPVSKKEVQTYRNSSQGLGEEYEELRTKIDSLAQKLEREISDNKEFNGAIISSLSELANEVSKGNPEAEFAKTFNEEYRNMHSKEDKPSNFFDSDLSDFSDED